MSDRTELLAQADSMNLTYAKNIPTLKLEELILGANNAPVEPAAVEEQPENISKLSKAQLQRRAVKIAKDKAFATSVVTITNRDNRENDVMTTTYLSFENQFFGLSKLVPLDIPVELEQGLIAIAEATMIVLHKDEIVDGRRTGNKVPVQVKKFAVSYSKPE